MIENQERIGRFTSSEIYKLIGGGRGKEDYFSATGLTYIEEKNIERKLGKSIGKDPYSQDMAWGTFMENFVFNLLGTEYKICSKKTVAHPNYGKFWSGSSDMTDRHETLISEIKCYQLKNFSLYTDCLLKQDVTLLKKDFPKEYWQIVSNSEIHQVPFGEAVSYAPFESEMSEIRSWAENHDSDDQWKYRFIVEKSNAFLACIKDGGYYNNINKFRFEVPKEDKEFLIERVVKASEKLVNV